LKEKIVLNGFVKTIGRTAGRGSNQQNTAIRDHFLGRGVRAIAFMETGEQIVAVYHPAAIRVRAAVIVLTCVGRGGARTNLEFTITRPSADSWRYEAWDPTRTDFFQAIFVLGPAGGLRLSEISHNSMAAYFSARGLPDAVLAHCAQMTNQQIVSSTSADPNAAEYRTLPAEKMWRRLGNVGRAQYNAGEDRHYYVR
jgi:hypothetical protein